MSTLNDLHGKVPPPPVHVVPLGSSVWDVQTINKPYVRLATCRDRNVADYIAALWNLMPQECPVCSPLPCVDTYPEAAGAKELIRVCKENENLEPKPRRPYRRRKAGKSVQVVP